MKLLSRFRFSLPLLAVCLGAILNSSTVAFAEDPAGEWVGKLSTGLSVRIRVVQDGNRYRASWINASGNASPLEQFTSDGVRFSFGASQQGLRFEGQWDAIKQTWSGKLVFQGQHPLELKRAPMVDASRRRPMEDAIRAAPRPYSEEAVGFANASAGIRLAGTLILPRGPGPFPAVVLISGSGMNRRDQDVAGHKVFMVWADALARRGVAVLRYDKRGVGQSTGNYADATTSDFASDAAAAVRHLRTIKAIDRRSIGLVGHSEGGVIAPMVALNDPGVGFIATVAGPAVRGDLLFVEQAAQTARAAGAPESYIVRRKLFDAKVYASIVAAPNLDAARKAVRIIADEAVAKGIIEPSDARDLPESKASAWMREFLARDPAAILRKLKVPILAVYGARDVQVVADQNVPAARDALKNNRHAAVVEVGGTNHLLQRATSGSPSEYGEIEETIAPAALTLLTDWVVKQVERRAN